MKKPKARSRDKQGAGARGPVKRRARSVPAGAPPAKAKASSSAAFLVAGIGASAGGLEACSQLLENMPAETGMAFILVQHLSPTHVSALPSLLGSSTSMPVEQVTEGMKVAPNRVYIIPPDTQMELIDGALHLLPRPQGPSQHTPIDHFLRSLARECRERSIGIILSGTASDGAQGVKEIKAAGGIVIAQDPTTAHYAGMPHAAISTGLVDIVAAPREIARRIVEIGQHSYVRPPPHEDVESLTVTEDLAKIFGILRNAKGVDFSLYKPPTIQRRIQRRMALHKIEEIETYFVFLKDHPSEVDALYHDILIQVTHFFREPETLQAVVKQVFPVIFANRGSDSPARIWVPGCATGEEVYSLAILLLEFLDGQPSATPIQIFGTDVSEAAIDHARMGVYPGSISEHVSAERLRRFFTTSDGSYRVNKKVRDLCIFARQDLSRDPPFSRLDLIVCRNVLIYLGAPLQKKLMSVFHYALRPTGFLVLGKAETVGTNTDLFSTMDKKHRIFSRKFKELAAGALFSRELPARHEAVSTRPVLPDRTSVSVLAQANQCLLERFAPPGVVVDGNMQIVQFRGQTGPYLEPAPGSASLNLLKMAREGLLHGLRGAMHAARKRGVPVHKGGLRVRSNGGYRTVSLEVIPLGASDQEKHYLVVFHDASAADGAAVRPLRKPAVGGGGRREQQVARLQQELAASRDYLQSMIQDLEAANEELQSANEEILSSNEELQSTNEELDTAKEELQSINEELNTVNEELHGRNEELSRVNSDLVNLLSNVQLAIVMVGADLRIRRFTPTAERVLNLIPGDMGRPIGNIQPNIDFPQLQQTISDVIDTVTVHQRDVQDRHGRWYQLVIRPYKNMMNQIDGAVLALYDFEAASRHGAAKGESLELAMDVADLLDAAAVVVDRNLRIRRSSSRFARRFRAPGGPLEGRQVTEIEAGLWQSSETASALRQALSGAGAACSQEVPDPEDGGRTVTLHGRRLSGQEADPLFVLVVEEEKRDGAAHAR